MFTVACDRRRRFPGAAQHPGALALRRLRDT
jgi:hypothetical protein